MGPRNADDIMAQILDQALQIHRDEGLILDDQHVGRDLGGQFATRLIGEPAGLGNIRAQNEAYFFLRKALKREQEEGLPRQRRDIREPAFGRHR